MSSIIDLIGSRFGKLTVIERAIAPKLTGNGQAFWSCLCDCGEYAVIPGQSLRSGATKSCGCGRVKKIESNSVYGLLTVIKRHGTNNQGSATWLCKCKCGLDVVRPQYDLIHGRSTHCGCKNKLTHFEAAKRAVLTSYKTQAKQRKLSFELTEKQFFTLINQDCYYCGEKPSNTSRGRYLNGGFLYNGVDRIDNKLGYSVKNSVPCCKWCNIAKRHRAVNDFKTWVIQAATYMQSK
jgi:hypothetical protein